MFQSGFSLLPRRKERCYCILEVVCFLCAAQKKERAPSPVLIFFLLFQARALSQTTDVVLQSKIRPLLDEKPNSCACIIPDCDEGEIVEL